MKVLICEINYKRKERTRTCRESFLREQRVETRYKLYAPFLR